jgi:hypothetical protein
MADVAGVFNSSFVSLYAHFMFDQMEVGKGNKTLFLVYSKLLKRILIRFLFDLELAQATAGTTKSSIL